jgi:hypothetical protein
MAENRQGHLSTAQAARLRREAIRLAAIIVAFLAGLGVVTIFSARLSASEMFPLFLCLTVPALVTLAFTIGVTENAIGPRTVSKITGQVHLAFGLMDYSPPLDYDQRMSADRGMMLGFAGSYRMIVGNQRFRLSRDEYNALRPAVYTIYYLPTIRKVVAVEWVDIGAPRPRSAEVAETGLPFPTSVEDEGGDMLRG